MPPLIRRLLSARGLTDSAQAEQWLSPRLSDLRDPHTLQDMEKAIDRLVAAFEKKELVAIYGDFDLDGTSALALLNEALIRLGFRTPLVYQPSRLQEGYGLHAAAVEKLKAQGASLILTVDVGITAIEAAKKCKELGLDLIITDHHLAQNELPEAFALVNPNVDTCISGLGHLCGVGLAFYVAWALKRALVKKNLVSESALDLKDLLDCFVVGTLTDMVPLIDENRVLVKHGLIRLAQTDRPGLRTLLAELGLWGRPLSSQDVAIRFAPKLNALSRMELGLRPLDLFLVNDEQEAQRMVRHVLEHNSMRVNLQAEAEQIAMSVVEAWKHEPFIFLSHEKFHRGVVGLIATKLSQLFQKPTFVGSLSDDGSIVGSARAPSASRFNLVKALEIASPGLIRFGGHALAAGFELDSSKTDLVVGNLKDYFANLPPDEVVLEIPFDTEAKLQDFSPGVMKWLEHIGPFGQSFDTPVFLLRGLEIAQKRDLKGGHIRLNVKDTSASQSVAALLFSPAPEQDQLLKTAKVVDILAEPQWNYYQGKRDIQLLIKELRLAQ